MDEEEGSEKEEAGEGRRGGRRMMQEGERKSLTSQLCHWFGIFGRNFWSQTTFLMSSIEGSEGTMS